MIVADKLQIGFDEIIEKFNVHYANVGVEMEGIIDDLSSDESLRMNIRNSVPSAYEPRWKTKSRVELTNYLNPFRIMQNSKICTSKKDKILLKK